MGRDLSISPAKAACKPQKALWAPVVHSSASVRSVGWGKSVDLILFRFVIREGSSNRTLADKKGPHTYIYFQYLSLS